MQKYLNDEDIMLDLFQLLIELTKQIQNYPFLDLNLLSKII